MTAEQFACWLQGFSEVAGRGPTEAEWTIIQDRLKTVFTKVTPLRSVGGLGADIFQRAIPLSDPMPDLSRATC